MKPQVQLLNRLKITTVNILSIDGGGIRGIVPAMVLAEVEEILKGLGKETQAYRNFHVIAGTSTGGLIALGLATPRGLKKSPRKSQPTATAKKMVEFYRQQGSYIFPLRKNNLINRLAQAFRNKYDDENFTRLLKKLFGQATIKDTLTNVLIASYDTVRREPRFFKKRPALPEWEDDPNFYVRDVARATAAAPTFFTPALISPVPDNGSKYSLVDGAVFANNPVLSAYIEARKIYPHARKTLILSLGTGITDKPYPYEDLRHWGYIDWMSPFKSLPLLSMITDGQSDSAIHMLKRLPGVELYRLDFQLDKGHSSLDDATPENIKYLQQQARKLIEANRPVLHKLCRKL